MLSARSCREGRQHRAARPQAGVSSADVVYVEEVEAGVTRLAVVRRRCPPRSDRSAAPVPPTSSCSQWRPITLAYRANDGVQEELNRSGCICSATTLAPGFARNAAGRRSTTWGDPTAFRPAAVAHRARHRLPLGPAPPGGKPISSITASYPGRPSARPGIPAVVKLMSSTAAQRRRLRGQLSAATVVVQYVDVEDSGYVDVVGSPTLLIRTVGSGPAVVLRDGVGYDATWSARSRSPDELLGRQQATHPSRPVRCGCCW